MKTVYFIRHGESETNAGGMRQGSATLLTEVGRRQAQFMAERASKLPIDLVVSSTMRRARETAEPIVHMTHKPIEYSELFIERVWPTWFYGRLQKDPEVVSAMEILRVHFAEPQYRLADEESAEDLKQRAIQALAYLEGREEEHIMVVMHGFFLRVMLAVVIFGHEVSLRDIDCIVGGMQPSNTGITVIKEDLKWRSGWRLHVFNDHAHLAD